ncbi:hypothetical protein CDD83_9631 [Cordyceps sp. RAO-2017]|nr:hypothetical protein CDD83_9631 [Cordyceps sp. RAO-2017]
MKFTHVSLFLAVTAASPIEKDKLSSRSYASEEVDASQSYNLNVDARRSHDKRQNPVGLDAIPNFLGALGEVLGVNPNQDPNQDTEQTQDTEHVADTENIQDVENVLDVQNPENSMITINSQNSQNSPNTPNRPNGAT